MKHKHYNEILAWAGGAKIQYNVPLHGDDWYDCQDVPLWNCTTVRFRVKPEVKKPVVRWLWAIAGERGCYHPSSYFYTEQEASKFNKPIKLEWSRQEFPT